MKNIYLTNLGTGSTVLIAIVVIVVLLIFYYIKTYNGLVNLREFVRNAMGNISAQIESRWDALSSIIDATKKYSEHEAKVLEDITRSRAGISKTSSAEDVEKDDSLFNQALGRINAVIENYPELKASELYTNAMNSINTYENNVRMSRMVYNDTVTKLNRKVQQFPSSIVASMSGFTQEEYFKNSEQKADMPKW